MIKNPFNLKQILAASSTLFFFNICDPNVYAINVTTNGDASLGDNTNWVPNAPTNYDSILYGGAHRLNANVDNRIIQSIDLNGNNPQAFTINNSLSIGSIGDTLVRARELNIIFDADSQILNLTGTGGGVIAANDYNGLGSIDFNGKNSVLKISSANTKVGANLYGNKSGTLGQVSGIIEIDADNVTLSGLFEDTTLRRVVNINVNSNKSLILDTDLKIYNDLGIADGGVLRIRAGKNLSSHNIKSDPASTSAEAAKLIFEGNSEVNSFVGIGENSRLGFIEFTNPNSRVEFKKSVELTQYFTMSQNSEAIFSDGADFSATNVIPTVQGSGIFTFQGDSIVKAALTGIDSININGVGKTVTLSTAHVANNINIANNATVKFLASVDALDIKGLNLGTANVEFLNNNVNTVINSDLGAGGKLNTIRISRDSLSFTKTISANNIEFTNPSQIAALKLSGRGQLGAINITTASNTRLHNIWVNSDQEVTGNIGTEANPLGTIKLMSNKTIKVNTSKFYTDVSTVGGGEGVVEFIKSGSFSYSLGDSANYLSEIKFIENAEVRGSAYSQIISIQAGKTGSFKKRTNITDGSVIKPYIRAVNGLRLEGIDSTAYFGDSCFLYNDFEATTGNITTNFDNEGKVIFEGAVDLKVNIGTADVRLKEIEFAADSPDKTINLSRNMYAKNIGFNGASVNVISGGEIGGNATFNNTILDIGQHILVFSGGEARFTGNPTIKVYFDNNSNSHATIKGVVSKINLSNAETLTFDITDNSTLPPNAGRTYNFFRYEDGGTLAGIDLAKVKIKDSNPFVSWSYQNNILLQKKDIIKGLASIVKAAKGNPDKLPQALKNVDTDVDSAASRFIGELVSIAAIDPARAGEALDRVINATDPADEVAVTNVNNAQLAIFTARIDNSEQFKFRLVDKGGVSAGDEASSRFGAWANPFYSQATQKKKRDLTGYKSKSIGGSIGFDTMINDNLILGIAGTALNTKVNYKDQRAEDSSKINSLLFSIYGLQSLSNNWFMQAITSIGVNKVNNTRIRYVFNGSEQALSKYTSHSYGLEFKSGYNYNLTEKAVLTPNAGFRYNHFFGNRYQEFGTSNQNLGMGKRNLDKFEGIAGLQLAMMFEHENVKLIPQIHSAINYNFSQKSPSTNINLEGLASPMLSRAPRPDHTLWNIGTGMQAKVGCMEYELNYDAHLASKYISHQGSFKIRVNF